MKRCCVALKYGIHPTLSTQKREFYCQKVSICHYLTGQKRHLLDISDINVEKPNMTFTLSLTSTITSERELTFNKSQFVIEKELKILLIHLSE